MTTAAPNADIRPAAKAAQTEKPPQTERPPPAGNPPQMSRLLLLLGSIAILMPFSLDIYLPALPAIAADLKASAGAVQLTLPAYFVGLAISQLFFGSIADHFGRRTPLLCGLVVLIVGSTGCALAQNITALTAWRLVQALGVGSASVIPRAIVRDRFDVAHTARALSLLGLISGLGPILAPQIGGAILLIASWRYEFWFLTTIALGCLISAYFNLAESIPAERASAIGPRLWFRLLTDKRFLRFAVPANMIQASVYAYVAGAPFVYIDQLKLTPQQFAWMFGCNAVGLMIVSRINARIVSRLGPELIFRRAMLASATIGIVLFAVAVFGRGGFWALAIPQFLLVSVLGFNFANGFALALAPFGNSAGTASALFGTMQFVIASLGIATVSALYDGTARAMTGVVGALSVAAVVTYRSMK
jgi:DHA1 family bicyclomycin/chloramphenicol resistance-like MFS transporter